MHHINLLFHAISDVVDLFESRRADVAVHLADGVDPFAALHREFLHSQPSYLMTPLSTRSPHFLHSSLQVLVKHVESAVRAVGYE